MEFLNKKEKIILFLIGGAMIIFIGIYILKRTENVNYIEFETSEETAYEEEIEENTNEIKVHIAGEVEKEGVIEIEENSRIEDVIEKAGGTTMDADLSKINLAYTVKDGQKIYIPNIEEGMKDGYISEDAGDGVLLSEQENKQEKVNINTAKQTELETLSGIGPSTALKIINYRNENGNFKDIEELKNVPGIGESKFEAIKEDICI